MKTHQHRCFAGTRFGLVALAGVLGAGCGEGAVGQTVQPVVYGADDRTDVYAHPNAALRTLAQRSIVALMRDTVVDATDPARVVFRSETLSTAQELCPGQRFAENPTAAHCSGTLIADDLVLTAGHCFDAPGGAPGPDGPSTCDNTRFVFGYHYEAEGRLATVSTADVFSCARVLVRVEETRPDGRQLDYAVVRLDRSAVPRFAPARITPTQGPSRVAQSVTVIGSGSGIPAKIDAGGRVTTLHTPGRDFFEVNTDTFQGNSGSGVFDTERQNMIGILVRGATDYVRMDGCNVVNVCGETPSPDNAACAGESVNYLQPMFDDLCRAHPMVSLCAGFTPAPPTDPGAADAEGGGCSTRPSGRASGGLLGALGGVAVLVGQRRGGRRRKGAEG